MSKKKHKDAPIPAEKQKKRAWTEEVKNLIDQAMDEGNLDDDEKTLLLEDIIDHCNEGLNDIAGVEDDYEDDEDDDEYEDDDDIQFDEDDDDE